ncbi:MAG: glycosyltransferase [Pseudomonadota bacterium]
MELVPSGETMGETRAARRGETERRAAPSLAAQSCADCLADVTVVVALHDDAHVMPGLFDGVRRVGAVIVVDSASRDQGPALARAAGAQLVRLPEYRGRAAALNAGASLAATSYVLFLKPDVRISEAAAGALAARLRRDRDLFAAAPPIRIGFRSIKRDRNRLGLAEGVAPDGPSGLSGAALMVRRDAFERLEGFDHRILQGLIEDDLTRRALARGWRLALLDGPEARRAPIRVRPRRILIDGAQAAQRFKEAHAGQERKRAEKRGQGAPRFSAARRSEIMLAREVEPRGGRLIPFRPSPTRPAPPPRPRPRPTAR